MKIEITSTLIEAYVFANTPSYLFKKILNDEFTKKLENEDVITLENLIKSSKKENIESIAAAYAAIIALTKKGELNNEIILAANEKLRWSDKILALYKQKVPSMSNETFTLPKVFTENTSVATSSNSEIVKFKVS